MTARLPLTVQNKLGLVLAAVLGLVDVVLIRAGVLVALGLPDPEGEADLSLLSGTTIVSLILPVVTIIAVLYTWVTANRIGARVVVATRVVSALVLVPILFTVGGDAAGQIFGLPVMPFGAGHLLVTFLAILLVLFRPAVDRLKG